MKKTLGNTERQAEKALLILNLGSPETASVKDVKKFLKAFLTDKRVIDIPFLTRQLLVRVIIAPFRARKSAEAYQSIWTDKGSPLKVITEKFSYMIAKKLPFPVAHAMRYGTPTPADALLELKRKSLNLKQILIAPMYPHYAMSSYETAIEHAKSHIEKLQKTGDLHKDITLKMLKPFYNEPAYISALCDNIQPFSPHNFDAVLFSYHGLPIRHIKKADPTKTHCYMPNCCENPSVAWETCYRHQITVTTQLVAEKLGLTSEKTLLSFQSRLGPGWMEPFTDVLLKELPAKNIKKLLVICPAFVADCLETLEEMHIRGKAIFMQNGGKEFQVVPCLNTSKKWVDVFTSYCIENEGKYKEMWS